MATLNGTYQYIGRSNAVSSPSGWNYYILLYAKTVSDVSAGKHTVSVKMRLTCDVDSTFYGWRTTGSVTVNGSSAFSWSRENYPNSAWNTSNITEGGYTYKRWIDLNEGSVVVDVGHGVAKNITIAGSWVMNSTYSEGWFPYTGVSANVSVTVTLPMLASASTITSAANVTLGNACSVTWTPQSASFRYKLKFSLGSWNYTTGVIHPNTSSAYIYSGYAIPLDVANQIATSKTGKMTVTLYTYSDSGATTQIGSADSEKFTVTVPETTETAPTVSMTLSPVSSLASPFNTLYIQGRSKVDAELSFSTKYGATVAESYIDIGGVVYKSPYTSDYLSQAGDLVVKGVVKDSR